MRGFREIRTSEKITDKDDYKKTNPLFQGKVSDEQLKADMEWMNNWILNAIAEGPESEGWNMPSLFFLAFFAMYIMKNIIILIYKEDTTMLKRRERLTREQKMEKKIDLLNSMIIVKDNTKLFKELEKTYKKIK